MYSVRVVSVDYYQATPIPDVDPTFSQFRGSDIKQVPIIRIFGVTANGEKVCLHIHGVFPYMYVPYTGQIRADIQAYQLAACIDTAVNVSLGSARTNAQHVYKIQQVSGIPFYGYHQKKHHFFKIYYYNPAMQKRATDLLQSGSVMDQIFQPYEAHIPFTLQFMMDYNIYGMSMINLKHAKRRHSKSLSPGQNISQPNSDSVLDVLSNDKDYLPFSVTKQSVCQIEIDAWASDIINREVIDNGVDSNPGIAAIWAEEKARRSRAALGGDSQLTNPPSPERPKESKIPTENDIYNHKRLIRRLVVLETPSNESLSSPSSGNISYPIQVSDNSNLLNASQLEIHAGPLDSSVVPKSQNKSLDKSLLLSQTQHFLNDISLDTSDVNVLDMLTGLANNRENNDMDPIDSNSILGTQHSQAAIDNNFSEQIDGTDEEDDFNEANDLNMTNFQLDNIHQTQLENFINLNNSQPEAVCQSDSQISLVLESLSSTEPAHSLKKKIPQVDGPIDDENSQSNSSEDVDQTIASEEFLICDYKSDRGRKAGSFSRSTTVTPRKRKRISSSEDDGSSNGSAKKRPRTPRRSPLKRMSSKLMSPSCPNRTYSPLCVEIRKTPKNSPMNSPSTSGKSNVPFDKDIINQAFYRKNIFSPVEESEEEPSSKINVSMASKIKSNLFGTSNENVPSSQIEDKSSKNLNDYTSSEQVFKSKLKLLGVNKNKSQEIEDAILTEDSDNECFSQKLNNSKHKITAEKNEEVSIHSDNCTSMKIRSQAQFLIQLSKNEAGTQVEEGFESDKTLVEDSDESTHTITLSPTRTSVAENPLIINDSDMSNSQGIGVDIYTSHFPSETVHTLQKDSSLSDLTDTRLNISCNQENLPLSQGASSSINLSKNEEVVLTTIEDVINCQSSISSDKTNLDKETSPVFSDDVKFRVPFNPSQADDSNSTTTTSSSNDSIPEFNEDDEIIPVESPPSKISIEKWLEEMKQKQKNEKPNEEKKLRVLKSRKSELSSKSAVFEPSVDLSRIFHDTDSSVTSKHIGVSCGQIEFTNRISMANVGHENLGNDKAMTNHQFLTILCLEVHVITRPNLLPDPRKDPIGSVFYAIHNDVPPDWTKAKTLECGVIIVDQSTEKKKVSVNEQTVTYVANEDEIFQVVVDVISRSDPDILIGWDMEFLSWGYMFQRASLLGKSLGGKISRIPNAKCKWEAAADEPMQIHLEILAEVRLPGRIVLDIWRIMRHEIALYSYTYESIMYNVLNERVPYWSFDVLTKWWNTPNSRWRVIDNYCNRVIGVHRLLHHLDIINRTSEHARLYGVQFFEVFSRGSQFRVESMMLRLAKPMNYIPVSPSPHQRACMRAPESLPLIMEPESTMYRDPVVVLDFQSLYPSIIIAYNYCFSTCLGRVDHIGSLHPFEFGCTNLKIPKKLAQKLQNRINYAPCGVAFVKEDVRKGILPRMLMEILDTRFMVKKAMKDHPKSDRALQRALHSRQLGLKLIANVTYGYTAANFSGRMPCIEVGDSVVSKGKETLERAIKLVESTPEWGARVIYGDTDSLFILLKGKTREEAFDIGAQMADAVTAANPKPVKLKFEKVMQPCILQTKKRYCGYMYENVNDKPVYLAKGIETVRRDGCPAVAKILEKSLRTLFDTNDMSKVKDYVTRQLDKILSGRASIQDLTFAKEFRGMKGYKAAACVPSLELTKRMIQKDPRAVPRTGARVPYIIVSGAPNEPLIKCVKSPMELIEDPCLRPNAIYYITKVIIPPINRCIKLIGVDALNWFMEMPHRQAPNKMPGAALMKIYHKQKTTISQYLCNTSCPSCGQSCDKGICENCVKNQSRTLVSLHEKCRQYERIHSNCKMICNSCIGIMDADSCTSLDCPIFYQRVQSQRDSAQIPYLYDLIQLSKHL